jgi:CheY-like chemotaxis protein
VSPEAGGASRAPFLARLAEARRLDPARVGPEARAGLSEWLAAPLRTLLALADDLARETSGDPRLAEAARRIRVSGRLLVPLLAEVLDPERVPAGTYPDEWAAVAARLRAHLSVPVTAVGCHAGLLAADPAAGAHPALAAALERIREAVDEALARTGDAAALLALLGGGNAVDASPEVREVAARARVAPPPPPARRPRPGERAAVLVVDDSQVNRDLLHRLLTRQGYEVVLAEGGLHALALLRARPFGLVLLDLIMPEVDGIQVLQQMKADRHLRGIPVIMVSALDEVAMAGRCVEMGADDYVAKPFDPVILRERVGAALERRRQPERAAAEGSTAA